MPETLKMKINHVKMKQVPICLQVDGCCIFPTVCSVGDKTSTVSKQDVAAF